MNIVYSEFLSLEWFWVLFPQKVPKGISNGFHLALASLLAMPFKASLLAGMTRKY